jgi:hypothetical protein
MSARVALIAVAVAVAALHVPAALAIDAIAVGEGNKTIPLADRGEIRRTAGDLLTIETPPNRDGIVQRLAVRSIRSVSDRTWFVFALRNPSGEPIERWLRVERTVPHERTVLAVIASAGVSPERIADERLDLFRLTLDPGQTVTFVAELSSGEVPPFSLQEDDPRQGAGRAQ